MDYDLYYAIAICHELLHPLLDFVMLHYKGDHEGGTKKETVKCSSKELGIGNTKGFQNGNNNKT